MLGSDSRKCVRCTFGEPRCTVYGNQVTHLTGDCIPELSKPRMM
jgi:hypothetical protein